MSDSSHPTVIAGDGYAITSLDDLGEGYGFRKVRAALGVTAFGVNAIVMPEGYASNEHYHDHQQELYFVHKGTLQIEFGDGSAHRLEPGGMARVDPATVRRMRNVGEGDAIYLCAGGKDGYVGRDGQTAERPN